MTKSHKELKEEIQEMREKLYACIDETGIIDDPALMAINTRLDEMILQWMKDNK